MTYYTYDVTCDGKPWYAGHTKNVENRLSQHSKNGLFDDACSCSVKISNHSSKKSALKHEKKLVGNRCHTKNTNLKKIVENNQYP